MNHNASRSTRKLHGKLLATAIVAALGVGAIGAASAEPIPLTPEAHYTLQQSGTGSMPWMQTVTLQNYIDTIGNTQYLNAGVGAALTGGDSILVDADMSGAAVTNSHNTLQAGIFDSNTGLSGANGVDNSIDLAGLGSEGANAGLGILSGQLVDGAPVTTSIDGGQIATTLTNYVAGDVTHSDNAIQALTSLDSASNKVTGALPDEFSGTTAGSVDYQFSSTGTTTLDATGSVYVGNAQATANATAGDTGGGDTTSYAHVADSSIGVTDTSASADTPLAVNVSADRNAITASYAGNASNNAFSADATGGKTFAGSVAVANAQVNRDDGGSLGSGMARVSNSGIGVNLTGSLDGSLGLSHGTISASAQGNDAGNVLAFAQGIDVRGQSTHASGGESYGTTAQLDGDLILFNNQNNQGTRFDSTIESGSSVLGAVSHLAADSTITLEGNGIVGSASGNRASNQVSADGASFAANTVVGSQQVNRDTDVSSVISGSMIASGVLGDPGSAYAGLDDVSHGNVTVSSNTIGATASGNRVTTAVDLKGGEFNTYAATDAVDALVTGSGYASLGSAGVGIGNQQNNFGDGSVTASVDSGIDTFGQHGGWIGAYFNGGVDAATVSTADDTVTAGASGNAATTTASVGGTNGKLDVQMANSQINQSEVTAAVDASRVGIYLGGGSAENSALSVTGGALAATASGNQATNSVDSDFVNLSVGGNPIHWDKPSSVVDATAQKSGNRGALVISSAQKNTADITATTSDGFIGAEVGEHPWPGLTGPDVLRGNVSGGSVAVSDNHASARATANSVGNSVSIQGGNFATESGYADQVATLGNLQEDAGSQSVATVSRSGTDARKLEQIGAIVHGNADDTALSVAGNGIDAFAGGNLAGNTLAATFDKYAPSAPASPDADVGYVEAGSASAEFVVQNMQVTSGAGSRMATVSNGNIGFNLTDGAPDDRHHVADSTLGVSGNHVAAEARDNQAVNLLGLGASYPVDANGNTTVALDPASVLSTSAALGNTQDSDAAITATVDTGLVGVIAGHYDFGGNDIDVSGNSISATGVGNTATDRMDVDATQLGGNGYLASGTSGVDLDNGGAMSVGADYLVSSVQQRSADVTANLTGAGIGMGLGEGDLDGGSVSVAGNAQSALAQQNTASNTLNLQGSGVDATAALANEQSASGVAMASAITDSTDGLGFAVQIKGSVGTTAALPLTVTDNSLTVQAGQNDASNSINVTADSSIAGSAGGVASADAASADVALASQQTANGSSVASMSPGLTGLEVIGNDASATSSAIGNAGQASQLTVSGNQFVASASANHAGNAIALNGAANIGASAALSNVQSSDSGVVTASLVSADVGVYNRDAGMAQGGAISNATMTVSGNTLAANASGNSAGNSISAQPVALNAAAPGITSAIAGNGAVASASADYAVLNAQSNGNAVTASVGGSSIGVNAGLRGSASQMLGSVATVGNNRMLASAAGNSASNGITLASVAGTMPSASLVSSQVNNASITATVNGARIGVTAGGVPGISNSPVVVTGNVISATAAGNSAVNHIGVGL